MYKVTIETTRRQPTPEDRDFSSAIAILFTAINKHQDHGPATMSEPSIGLLCFTQNGRSLRIEGGHTQERFALQRIGEVWAYKAKTTVPTAADIAIGVLGTYGHGKLNESKHRSDLAAYPAVWLAEAIRLVAFRSRTVDEAVQEITIRRRGR